MNRTRQKTLHYKRSNFATQLPLDYLYTPSHAWIAPAAPKRCRVGLTRFATRMLGEIVEHEIDIPDNTPVQCGQIIGWIEGFKAISDLFCVAEGTFMTQNLSLRTNIQMITKDPYDAGWLYEVEGQPDPKCLDAHAYRDLLDQTIERLLAQQQSQ